MIVTAVLGIGFIFALAGDFVLWAKLDEQRKATAEEYNRRWDEISRAVGLENEITHWKEANTDRQKDIAFYLVELGKQYAECDKMQNRLSALLCPTNDHVWKDGVCVKCGRVQ